MTKKNLKASTALKTIAANASAAAKKSAPVKQAAKKAPAKKAAAPEKKPTASAGKAALPGRYDEPLESYSPYAQHRILLEKYGTDEAGQAKVLKYGTETLGLPESQVKTYIREKLNAIVRDEQKALGVRPTKVQVEKAKTGEGGGYELHFDKKTRDAAKRHILSIVRRTGMSEAVWHILEENGMFAIAPAHIRPVGKPSPLKTGDIVMDIHIPDSRAEVIEGGPEASVVRYLTPRPYQAKEEAMSNYYLHKVGTKSSMKAELEELAAKASARQTAANEAAAKAPAKKAVAKKAAPPAKTAVKKSATKRSAKKRGK